MKKVKLAGYQEIIDNIKSESPSTTHTVLDTEKDYKVMEQVNQTMEEVKRDFELKNMSSQISAGNVLLTG